MEATFSPNILNFVLFSVQVLDNPGRLIKEFSSGVVKAHLSCISTADALARTAAADQHESHIEPSDCVMQDATREFQYVVKMYDIWVDFRGCAAGRLVQLHRYVSGCLHAQ